MKEEMIRVTVLLPKSVVDYLKRIAKAQYRKVSQLIRDAILQQVPIDKTEDYNSEDDE